MTTVGVPSVDSVAARAASAVYAPAARAFTAPFAAEIIE